MARPWFKSAWTRIVPTSVERSTYVLFSSVALLLLFWKWQPMGGVIWNVGSAPGRFALDALFALGWLTVLITTFLINHSIYSGCAKSGCICWVALTQRLASVLPAHTAMSGILYMWAGCSCFGQPR